MPASASPIPVSAVILTRNEEDNIARCLQSVAWAAERLVVDSFSDDATLQIAAQCGARIVQHAFADFAAQRNFAQAQAAHDWVLFVDADESVSPELREEIQRLAGNGTLAQNHAYHIQRVHLFSGRWFPDISKRRPTAQTRAAVRRGEVPRLLDRRCAVWERPLHEVVVVPEPHGVLDGVLYHYASSNLSLALESFNRYTDVEAAFLHRTRGARRVTLFEAILRGVRAFVYPYVFWQWWRYGEQGLLMAILSGYTKFINYAKLSERIRIEKSEGIWTDRDKKLLGHHD